MPIQKCNCKHQFQDERYGAGNRVYTKRKDGTAAACTVCGNTKTASVKAAPKSDKK